MCDAVELAQTYIRRWPLQENVIRDYLLPLGLDTNHGYGKTPVSNSEVSKKRAAVNARILLRPNNFDPPNYLSFSSLQLTISKVLMR